MVLFPAWLHHSVAGNAGESERVSISFYIMFERFGETLARPKWGAQAEGKGGSPWVCCRLARLSGHRLEHHHDVVAGESPCWRFL